MTVQANTEACIVRLVEEGRRRTGTGFFVAPGYVLTCAHVVEPTTNNPPSRFSVESKGGTWEAMPEQWRPGEFQDLAVLRTPANDNPCVLLGAAAEPTDPFWTQGFVSAQGELRLEPATGEIEGERRSRLETGGPEFTLIKFKGGQIVPGMSGAPLLNLRTGAICGIVARTRNEHDDSGGLAVPVRTIFGCYPFIIEAQSQYHHSQPEWRLTGISLPSAELSDAEKARILLTFPAGPGGLLAIVPHELMVPFYALTPTMSTEIVLTANNLRVLAEPKTKPYLITLIGLPDPSLGSLNFWHSAFTNAAARGPRMLAALLYSTPLGIFDGLDHSLRELLATLRTWPVL